MIIGDHPAVSLVVTDVTQRNMLVDAHRELARQIVSAQEQERQRVSRELHDGIGQLLSSARHRLHAIEKSLKGLGHGHAMREIAQTRGLLEQTAEEVRRISRNLRPGELDDLGLIPAIRSLVEDFSRRSVATISIHGNFSEPGLDKQAELAVYRIVQEAFNNIERHAGASEVNLFIHRGRDKFGVRILDNGCGFDPNHDDESGFGLTNMKERATQAGGTLHWISQPGTGTEISLALPLQR
jgi:two-component system NarL family sensor kinase